MEDFSRSQAVKLAYTIKVISSMVQDRDIVTGLPTHSVGEPD